MSGIVPSKRNSSASAPSRTTWIWLARWCFWKAWSVSSTSLGLSSTSRISTMLASYSWTDPPSSVK